MPVLGHLEGHEQTFQPAFCFTLSTCEVNNLIHIPAWDQKYEVRTIAEKFLYGNLKLSVLSTDGPVLGKHHNSLLLNSDSNAD